MSVELLSRLRHRVIPMLEVAAANYGDRVPSGYPVIVDAVEQGVVGIEIDAGYALYFTSDGSGVFVELYRRAPRTDTRTSSSRQKYGGVPFHDRRALSPDISDQGLRNLIAELEFSWNIQPGVIHITDS